VPARPSHIETRPAGKARPDSAKATTAWLFNLRRDRIDNDILPTQAVGMKAVFVRRDPWAEVHATRPEAAAADRTIGTLADLPAVLEEWRSDPTRAKRPLQENKARADAGRG
jgi:hypothetical protein